MGLDLYVGTLARYHTGRWETIVQKIGREEGLDIRIQYPEGEPRRFPRFVAPLFVSYWRWRLNRKLGNLPKGELNWPEDSAKPYFSDKPDGDGRVALVLAAAHAEHPHYGLPVHFPDSFEDDPAYRESSKDYFNSMISILECHMFLPSKDNFLTAFPDPVGNRRFITSTGNLAWALDNINQTYWQADGEQISQWRNRGPISHKTVVIGDDRVFREEPDPIPDNPLEQTAQFGFAIYSAAVEFSRRHSLPILTDE